MPSRPRPETSARDIQQRVRAATDLDCSVGIGESKLRAKLGTGFGKPAGVFALTQTSWFALLGERPTDVLWGIGAKTAKRLSGMGICTVLQLSHADPAGSRKGDGLHDRSVAGGSGAGSVQLDGGECAVHCPLTQP